MSRSSGNEPRTKGQFVVGFIGAVSEISETFGKQMRNTLEANGIEDPQQNETYSMNGVVSAINQMADDVGSRTTHQIGIHQVAIPEWPPEVDTVEKGFEAMNDMYRGAYENFDEDALGKFRFEKTGDKEARAAVTEEFPYPTAFASGLFEGVLNEFGPANALTDLSEIDAESDEKVAYELRW